MGSVPRINCLLAIVPFLRVNHHTRFLVIKPKCIITQCLITLNNYTRITCTFDAGITYQYDKLNKGVSIVHIATKI